jgi:hypothetical protein
MWDDLLYPITYTYHMQESMVSDRRKIEERLRKKQAEVTALEEKLKVAKVYLTALRDIVSMFDKDDSGEGDASPCILMICFSNSAKR